MFFFSSSICLFFSPSFFPAFHLLLLCFALLRLVLRHVDAEEGFWADWNGMGIADGLCVIEVGLPAFGVSDEASAFDIAHAAWMIINTCVADFQHEGGRMDGVGMFFSPFPFFPCRVPRPASSS